MRRQGDLLLQLVSAARKDLLLCAPFIKAAVLRKVLDVVDPALSIRVVTRWIPAEVAAGVSDLEIFDVVAGRSGATLTLLDSLHAKIYVADGAVLVGSANLTAAALGWSPSPNVEILTQVDVTSEDVVTLLSEISIARAATAEERDRVARLAAACPVPSLPDSATLSEDIAGVWVPSLAAPRRLYEAYVPSARERLAEAVLRAADIDLAALSVPPGLSSSEFKDYVCSALLRTPAIRRLALAAEGSELSDTEALEILAALPLSRPPSDRERWPVIRDWLTYFLDYEIAPTEFILRGRTRQARRR